MMWLGIAVGVACVWALGMLAIEVDRLRSVMHRQGTTVYKQNVAIRALYANVRAIRGQNVDSAIELARRVRPILRNRELMQLAKDIEATDPE